MRILWRSWRDRIVPISENLQKFIWDLNFPFSKKQYLDLLNKIQKEFKWFKFHNLRHTFAYNLKNNWVDFYDTSQLLWHKSLSSTVAYSWLNILQKWNLINKIKFDFLQQKK